MRKYTQNFIKFRHIIDKFYTFVAPNYSKHLDIKTTVDCVEIIAVIL